MENVENVENVRIVKSVKLLSALAMTVGVGAAMVRLTAFAEATDPSLYSDLRWRHIGPFRGGRTVGAAGVAQQPNVFGTAAS